jgi:ABC-type glycerol-3-phosphate transport system substrate-binding protein
MRRSNILILLTILGLFLLNACAGESADPVVETEPQPTAIVPTDEQEIPAEPESEFETAFVPEPTEKTLRIWVSNAFVKHPDSAAAATLNSLVQSFGNIQSDVDISLAYKSAEGPGSMLNYVRYGRDVAPDVLPDIILLASNKITDAAADGLIMPLSGPLSGAARAELYPAASTMSEIDEQLFSYPLTLESMPVMVYRSDIFTATLPLTWEEIALNETISLGMDIGRQGTSIALSMYLAQQPEITDENGKVVWDSAVLEQTLTQLYQVRNAGVFPDATLSANSAETVWQLLASGQVNAIVTTAAELLARYDTLDNVRIGAVPGMQNVLTPIVTGWGWSVTATDPEIQALSAEFIAFATAPENLATSSWMMSKLPASRVAFQQWPNSDQPIHAFLDRQLESAQPFPLALDTTNYNLLQEAVQRVLIVGETPANAVARIINN